MPGRSKRKTKQRSKAHQTHLKKERRRRIRSRKKVGYGGRLRRKKTANKKKK